MITIFNNKELLITYDMKCQAEVRNILSANGIDYKVRTIDLQSASVIGSSRGRTGSYGINQNNSYEYKIYVHKKDYENALKLIK